jgi:hypothetical protein
MESQVLNEQIEAQARRVAAAFGVETWELDPGTDATYCGWSDNVLYVRWLIETFRPRVIFVAVSVRHDENETSLWLDEAQQIDFPSEGNLELMARGLYRLGIEDEGVLSQLPPLSAHEKLELRLSLPREFWPEQWLQKAKESDLIVAGETK